MNLLNTARAAADPDFQSRVQAAVVLTALDIVNDGTGKRDPKHTRALLTVQQPATAGRDPQFVWFTASNAAISGSVQSDGRVAATDSDVHYVVAGSWDVLFPASGVQE